MDIEAAALEGERTARLMAAQDVRTLVSFDGGRTLGPFRGSFEAKSDSLVGYIAVKHHGYWADMFVTAATGTSEVQQRSQAGLDALLRSAAPGVAAAALHAKATVQLGGLPLHPVLSSSIGHRIGLSLNEGGELRHDSRHALKLGEVYAQNGMMPRGSTPAQLAALIKSDSETWTPRKPAEPVCHKTRSAGNSTVVISRDSLELREWSG